MVHAWSFASQEDCQNYYWNVTFVDEPEWCNATWDQILCWPPTPPNTNVLLPCPPIKGVDPLQMAHRRCGPNGIWLGQTSVGGALEDPDNRGWTNYTMCFVPEVKEFLDKLHSSSEEDAKLKLHVAATGRIIEMVGLSISLTTIITSLFIFTVFRSLRNNRTRIHWHLFMSMKIQLVVRLTLYIDQYIIRSRKMSPLFYKGIDNSPVVCESFYVLLEYARTAMFMWMFIEGLYLHNMVTLTVFHDKPNYRMFYAIGWGLPVIMTATWASTTALLYTDTECWWGYNLSPYFWILEGPRLIVIFTNLIFLLNILRVLITKLKASFSSELHQIRKAARAAIVLLPLLGITNALQIVHSPLESSPLKFAVWTYVSTFLTAYQGFFVALIYCFMNNEVKSALKKSWSDYHSRRDIEDSRRQSVTSFRLHRRISERFGHSSKTSSPVHSYSTGSYQPANQRTP
ncbi:PDF receptor-like isoform X1 [Macrobrachium rosenbergii]|uniref:PDF receptor-like isoform X1 n=1 Tax=Macrobrachium rosenbergii TaxID=79674 RepID=UPI0034D51760